MFCSDGFYPNLESTGEKERETLHHQQSYSLTGSVASKLCMSCSDTVETTLHQRLRYSECLIHLNTQVTYCSSKSSNKSNNE